MVKLKLSDFNSLKNHKFESIDGILFYGPDRGQVLEHFKETVDTVSNNTDDGFSVFDLDPTEIKSNPSILMDEAVAISLLSVRKIIKIKDATDDVAVHIKTLLSQYEKLEALLVVSAGELSPSSKLRTLFETNSRLAVLANYLDDGLSISNLIKETLVKSGIRKIPDDVLLFLKQHLGEDRLTTRMELEKLSIYLYGKNEVTIEDAKNCIMDSSSINLYDLPIIVADGDSKKLSSILPRLLNEGYNPIQLLKIILNHFKNLYILAGEVEKGKSVIEVINNSKPAIFYKLKPSYEKQLRFWNTSKIMKIIMEINLLDIKFKTSVIPQDILLSNLLFIISSFVNKKV